MPTRKGAFSNAAGEFAAKLQWGRVVADAEGSSPRSRAERAWRFNGAASLPTRKGRHRSPSSWRRSRFNGAASLPTRKDRIAIVTSTQRTTLQWGRVVADAEGAARMRRST